MPIIDIVNFMERNYMNYLSMDEMAYYTGRSFATFKRDFKKINQLTPQRWMIHDVLRLRVSLSAKERKIELHSKTN